MQKDLKNHQKTQTTRNFEMKFYEKPDYPVTFFFPGLGVSATRARALEFAKC